MDLALTLFLQWYFKLSFSCFSEYSDHTKQGRSTNNLNTWRTKLSLSLS